MDIYVRRAERGDVPQMLSLLEQLDALHRKSYPERFNSHKKGGRSPHSLLKEMVKPSSEFWLAVRSRKVLGLAIFMHRQVTQSSLVKSDNFLLLDMLVVGEVHRRKGIGKMLIKQARKRAEEEGYSRIVVKVYEKNQGAIEFYEKLGCKTLTRNLELRLND